MHAYADAEGAPTPMLPTQSGEWLPLVEAAGRLGCSVDTARRRLKRGELPGRRVPMQGGHRWEVFVPLEGPEPMQPMQPLSADEHQIPKQPTQDLQALVDLVRDLSTQNVQPAGQVGHWQTRAQLAEERLKLLEAPAENTDAASVLPRPW